MPARKVLNLRVANCSCRGNFISWSGNSRPRIKSPVTTRPPHFLLSSFSSSPFVDRKWNDCFVLNLLRSREFLRSPISPYSAFIIVISIHPMARPIFHSHPRQLASFLLYSITSPCSISSSSPTLSSSTTLCFSIFQPLLLCIHSVFIKFA